MVKLGKLFLLFVGVRTLSARVETGHTNRKGRVIDAISCEKISVCGTFFFTFSTIYRIMDTLVTHAPVTG